MKKVERYCMKIQRECTHCSGAGCRVCAGKQNRAKKYAKANIPVEYWSHSFKILAEILYSKALWSLTLKI